MENVYPRNLAQRRLYVSKFAHAIPNENEKTDSIPDGLPEFLEISQGDGKSLTKEIAGSKPLGRDLSILKERERRDVLKKTDRF